MIRLNQVCINNKLKKGCEIILVSKTVKVNINNNNVKYFRDKGYNCESGEIIEIKFEDAGKCSKWIVKIKCDICGKEKEVSIYNYYKCYYKKYICDKCKTDIINNRKCEVCGSTYKVTNYLNSGHYLCNKHKKNIRKYGEIKRTRSDENEIRIFKDYAEFDTYDKEGNVSGTFKIDLDMIDFVKTHKIHKHYDGYAIYKADDNHRDMRLHRKVLGVECSDNSIYVDHINRDKSDNRKCNLRLVTPEQNARNTGMYSHNTSGYKGISFCKKRQRWEVYIHKNNKKINLGLYDKLNDAIQARELGELFLFGKDSPIYKELLEKYKNNEYEDNLYNKINNKIINKVSDINE